MCKGMNGACKEITQTSKKHWHCISPNPQGFRHLPSYSDIPKVSLGIIPALLPELDSSVRRHPPSGGYRWLDCNYNAGGAEILLAPLPGKKKSR